MLLNFIKNFFKSKYYFNPLIDYQISKLGDDIYTNMQERDIPITVSLSSVRENFDKLPITLYSLFNQTFKPDRIVLYLDEEYEDLANLPYEISQFIKNGLEIKFVKILKNYTKTINALKEYPQDIIVTAMDGVFYPRNWLKELYLSYISHPEDIQINSANIVASWRQKTKPSVDFAYIPNENSGVLYPPKCFSIEVFRKDIFLKQVGNNEALWFWLMGLINNHKFRIVKNNYKKVIYTSFRNRLKNSVNTTASLNSEYENLLKLYVNNINQKI